MLPFFILGLSSKWNFPTPSLNTSFHIVLIGFSYNIPNDLELLLNSLLSKKSFEMLNVSINHTVSSDDLNIYNKYIEKVKKSNFINLNVLKFRTSINSLF